MFVPNGCMAPMEQERVVAAEITPDKKNPICCHTIKENFRTSGEVSAYPPGAAGAVPFAGERGPIFSLHSSHPTVAHSPSQTAVGMPPILQSRQKDLVEKSLVWVFLSY